MEIVEETRIDVNRIWTALFVIISCFLKQSPKVYYCEKAIEERIIKLGKMKLYFVVSQFDCS
jgi:hypothetical protein